MEDNMAEQGDAFSDGESGEGNSESEMKKSVGLKELQVCVTDVNLVPPGVTKRAPVKRGRGRPRSRRSTIKSNINGKSRLNAVAGDMNGDSVKRSPGRPKKSVVHEVGGGDDGDDSLSPPPKGSPKKPKLVTETSNNNEGVQSTPKKRLGRPVKVKRGKPKEITTGKTQEPTADGTRPSHRPGRPKGSQKKPVMRVESTGGRPTRVHVAPDKLNTLPFKKYLKRGRPKKAKMGRPRKTPLPSEEEEYQPRVWKALGRPRKYPKEERPVKASAPETPRKARGRPRKSESKKAAHLRKLDSDGSPRKRGRPPKNAKGKDGSPVKRGRPKGSENKALSNDGSKKMSPDSDHGQESAPPEEDLPKDEDDTVVE